MERILAAHDREAWATRLERPFHFESPFGGRQYALLLAIHDTAITPEEQAQLSDQLVRQGCRYAVCTGHRCSSWDDAIDMAHLLSVDPQFDPPESTFVMTTWHEEEPIADVAEFLAGSARFAGFEPERFLVVCLGGDAASYAEVRDAARAQLGLSCARQTEAADPRRPALAGRALGRLHLLAHLKSRFLRFLRHRAALRLAVKEWETTWGARVRRGSYVARDDHPCYHVRVNSPLKNCFRAEGARFQAWCPHSDAGVLA